MRYDAKTGNAVEATGLVKRFGKTTALNGVDLVARQGRVLGILGPNGAGKTTAVRMLATLLKPDGGQASVCGYDVLRDAHQVRQLIGLTGQYASVDEGRSGANNLIMIGRLLGIPRARAQARGGEGRGGGRRRLAHAPSVLSNPQVLSLDEPTTGLDPRSRTDVWAMIRGLVADGVTVLLTTQYLDEADQLAHDIVVIDQGQVVATGTPDELKAKTGGQVLQVSPADPARMAEVTALLKAGTNAEVVTNAQTGVATAPVTDAALVPHLFREFDDRGIELAEFTLRKASLDEVFLALTGRRADDEDTGHRDLEESSR